MKVELIDFTGANAADPAKYAADLLIYTKSTRLTQSEDTRKSIAGMSAEQREVELDYISKTIRSSWEMIDYTFQISGVTRAFTHQLVRTRTASYAQQAQRVVDMTDFDNLMPDTVAVSSQASNVWTKCMEGIADAYGIMRSIGIPAQDCRGVLPTNVLTNIIMKANLRTMADLLAKRKNLRAQGEYGAVAAEWEKRILEVHPWASSFLSPERTRTPALDALLAKELGSSGPLDKPELNAALKELDMLKEVWG